MKESEQLQRFDEWLREHAAILHHVANGFAEGADRSDLMQELLLALWKAIPAFRGRSRDSTFVYRVAHNAALTWKRSQRTYQRKLDRFESLGPAPASNETCHSTSAQLDLLYAEIRKLPPVDRSLMLLALDGVSYRDMAAVHGLSESNVGVRLNRARHKLTSALKGAVYEPQ